MAKKKRATTTPRKRKTTFPRGDSAFDAFQAKVMKKTKASMGRWHVDQAYVHDVLELLQAEWNTAWKDCQDKHSRTHDMVVRKDAARAVYEKELRVHVGSLQNNHNVSKAELEEMDIATNKGGRREKLPVTDTAPVAEHDTSVMGRIRTFFNEEDSDSRTWPVGADAIIVGWVIQDTEPQSIEDFSHFDTIFHMEEDRVYDLPLQGKVIWFIYCWVSPTGEKGIWSRIYRVRIP